LAIATAIQGKDKCLSRNTTNISLKISAIINYMGLSRNVRSDTVLARNRGLSGKPDFSLLQTLKG
jgi:hypothetical protein